MRKPVPVRLLATTALAPLLLAGLVACGPDDGNEASSDPSSTTSSTTSSTLSSSPSSSDTGTPPATEPAQPDVGEQLDPKDFIDKLTESFANTTTAQIAMTVNTTGLAMSATGQVDYTGDTPSMAMKMTAPALGSGTIDMRLIDGVMYMSMPMLDPSGKFFKIDLNDPDNPLGTSLGDLGSFDPQSTLETFSKGVKSVKFVGDDSIDGEDTEHYRVVTSTKDLSASLGGATPGVELPDEFTYDIWLDGDSRLRKMTADIGKQTSIEMEMTNWGEPVDISVPRADQIQEFPTS